MPKGQNIFSKKQVSKKIFIFVVFTATLQHRLIISTLSVAVKQAVMDIVLYIKGKRIRFDALQLF